MPDIAEEVKSHWPWILGAIGVGGLGYLLFFRNKGSGVTLAPLAQPTSGTGSSGGGDLSGTLGSQVQAPTVIAGPSGPPGPAGPAGAPAMSSPTDPTATQIMAPQSSGAIGSTPVYSAAALSSYAAQLPPGSVQQVLASNAASFASSVGAPVTLPTVLPSWAGGSVATYLASA